MKEILNKILKVFGWLVLLFAFASLGFATDNPGLMVPVYFIFFLLVFASVFIYNMKRQRKKEEAGITHVKPAIIDKIFGIILVLAAIFTPSFILQRIGFTFTIHLVLVLLTLVLIAASIFAVTLINKKKFPHNLIGYIILIVICSVPALAMMQHDRSYYAMGTAYYTAIIVALFAWFGVTTLIKAFKINA